MNLDSLKKWYKLILKKIFGVYLNTNYINIFKKVYLCNDVILIRRTQLGLKFTSVMLDTVHFIGMLNVIHTTFRQLVFRQCRDSYTDLLLRGEVKFSFPRFWMLFLILNTARHTLLPQLQIEEKRDEEILYLKIYCNTQQNYQQLKFIWSVFIILCVCVRVCVWKVKRKFHIYPWDLCNTHY